MRLDSTIDARVQRVQDIRRRIHAGRYPDNGLAFDIASDRLIDTMLAKAPPVTLADDAHVSDVASQPWCDFAELGRQMREFHDPDSSVEHAERWES